MIPKISICLPCYNGEKYIRECIGAIQSQSFFEFEIIVVDDQSTDNTYKIIEELAYHDERIKAYLNDTNLGLVGNWNRCLELANTPWIKYVFQDDLILPNCIEKLYSNCLIHNKKIGICNRRYVIDADADPNVKNYILNDLIKLDKYCHEDHVFSKQDIAHIVSKHPLLNVFGEPTSLIFHKSLTEKLGTFNDDLAQIVDYDFMVKLAINDGCYFSLEPLNFFRIHGDNQTNKNRGSNRNDEKRLKIEFVDAILLLHSFLYNENYANLILKEEHHNVLRNKYEAEIAKGIDQIGESKLLELMNQYSPQYENVISDIKKIKQVPTV